LLLLLIGFTKTLSWFSILVFIWWLKSKVFCKLANGLLHLLIIKQV